MDEPIAVIGLDARFPGDGDTADRFYEFLLAGRSARTGIPADRYNADSFWHPSSDRSGIVCLLFCNLVSFFPVVAFLIPILAKNLGWSLFDSQIWTSQIRAKTAHFLKGSISAFDAPFFSITPAEASAMDPQQRGMLEAVYKALENGESYPGSSAPVASSHLPPGAAE